MPSELLYSEQLFNNCILICFSKPGTVIHASMWGMRMEIEVGKSGASWAGRGEAAQSIISPARLSLRCVLLWNAAAFQSKNHIHVTG